MGTIYKLNFINGDFYIGKTSNDLKVRLGFHKTNRGKGSPLLENAYINNEYVGHEIIEEDVPTEILNITEYYWIQKLKPTLNTLPGGEGLSGLNHPRSKYSQEQLEEVVKLFLETDISMIDIGLCTGVGEGTVHDVCKKRSHGWIWETIPSNMYENAVERRNPTFTIYDENNNKHLIKSNGIKQYCKEHNLPYQRLYSSITNHKSLYGWSKHPHKLIKIQDPQGNIYDTNVFLLKDKLKDLSRFQKEQIITKNKDSGGWCILPR